MPLANTSKLMAHAAANHYAVPAFNAYNLESAVAIVQVAGALRSPVIIQAYCRLFQSPLAGCIAAAVAHMASTVDVPIALHLDHGAAESDCVKALRCGYSSVMIDGSALPLEENIALTARVVAHCRALGVPVEGELGHVGSAKNADEAATDQFTDPEEAKRFCSQTGVSMLAVMVGSAHGLYKQAPKLDIARIARIREATGIPLVLHGGSGIPDEEIRKAIDAGICKINVATDICQAFYQGMRHLGADDPAYQLALDAFVQPCVEQVKQLLQKKIHLFGAAGQAARMTYSDEADGYV